MVRVYLVVEGLWVSWMFLGGGFYALFTWIYSILGFDGSGGGCGRIDSLRGWF